MRFIVVLGLVLAIPVTAKADKLGFGVGVGTLGLEAHATLKLTKNFDAVLGVSSLDYDDTFSEAGRASVKATATIDAPRLGVQFFPFSRSGLFVEGGMVFGGPEINVSLVADENGVYLVDGEPYNVSNVGTIRGGVGFANDSAPYLLLGWGRSVGGGLGLNISIGAISYGSAKANLTSDCTYSLVGGFLDGANADCTNVRLALLNEQAKVNDDLDEFELWPFARIGLSFSF